MKYKTYEESLYNYLGDAIDEEIHTLYQEGKLGNWNGKLAIFHQNAPEDSDQGWEDVQYPQIIYDINWQAEPNRLVYGKLNFWINVIDKTVEPLIIAELIKKALKGVFFNTQYSLYSQSWDTTELYEYQGEQPLIQGAHLTFDVLAFPDQKTYLVPDPVDGINHYLKRRLPDSLVIGLDEMPDVFIPGELQPEPPIDGPAVKTPNAVVFLRTMSLTNAGKDTKMYRWTNYRAAVHVIANDYQLMRKTLGRITQSILVDGETELFDEWGRLYQLRFTDDGENLVVSYSTGDLVEGQIVLSTEFAILNLPPKIPNALHPNVGDITIKEREIGTTEHNPELWDDLSGKGIS